MSKQGQYNYSGINFQSWAAMSLFLQYLRDSDFSHIYLEAPEFQDFNLVFNDGRKIICEAKSWKKKFSFADLRKILTSILDKENIGKNDEVLIICRNLDKKLEKKVENIKYFREIIAPYFNKEKRFSKEEIEVLPKVNFWKVSGKINEKIIYSLFSELLNFWIPEEDLKRIVDSILMQKIYKCSAKGTAFTRIDLLMEIESLKREVIEKSGDFDENRRKIEDQLKDVIKAIKDNKSLVWTHGRVSALSAQPNLMYFVLQKFKEKKIDKLEDWKDLWELNKVYAFSFDIFKIFESNLHNRKNRVYILKFIRENLLGFRRFFRSDFFEMGVVKIMNGVIEQDKTLLNEAFEIVKELLKRYENEYFYLKSNQDSEWRRGEICKLLKKIYENSDESLKNRIYELITNHFNLIADDSEFSYYTPEVVFKILENCLTDGWNKFEKRFIELSKILAEQYEKFYKRFGKKTKFKGWELMGGVTTSWGHDYKVIDRHFIRFTLKPALGKYYKTNKKRCWSFVMGECISTTNRVSRKGPDFLNRASVSIILDRYRNRNAKVSNKAFRILKEFILSWKGIPHKSDLIYQELRGDFSDDKKWKLVKISIDKYKLPINSFVEQIVLELAKKRHKKSKEILRGWIRDPKYYKRGIFERNVIVNISQFLDVSFNEGVEMFKDFINGDYFLKKMDYFNAFEAARVLNKIIDRNFNTGLEILETLSQKLKLTDNEQILLCSSLTDKDDSKQENKKVLIKIYEEFLGPFLDSLDNDIKKIEKRITRPQSREAIVEFADALVKHQKIPEAMRIVRLFVNDSDPCTPEKVDSEDLKGEYDKHKQIEQGEDTLTINTVRGRCAWVLMNCAVLAGRDHIEEIINLTEKLTKDKNYYIQWMSCHSLSQLARNRLTIMPENKKELFFNKDREKALKMAKRVEKIAFELLEKFSKLGPKPRDVLMRALLKVFDHIRGLNQKDARLLLKKISKCGEKVFSEAAPLFIYFAEFRQKDFKNWKWQMPELYDDLENFDNKEFQKFLENILKKRNSKINSHFAWRFWKLTKESVSDKADIKNVVKYSEAFEISDRYLNILSDSYDHQTFKNIYYFIRENVDKRFKECYKLWRKCLAKEKPVMEKLIKEEKIYETSWWPFYHNDEILTIIKQKAGNKEFLNSFEFLLNYPNEANIGDIKNVVEVLQSLPSKYNQRVEKIFEMLIDRDPNFYDIKESWVEREK